MTMTVTTRAVATVTRLQVFSLRPPEGAEITTAPPERQGELNLRSVHFAVRFGTLRSMVAAPLRDGPPFAEAQLIRMSDCPSQRPAAMPRFLHGLTAIDALGALASTTREAPIAPGEPNDRAAPLRVQ